MDREILVIPQYKEYIESRLTAAAEYFEVSVLHRDLRKDIKLKNGPYFENVDTIALYVVEDRAVSYYADVLAQTMGKHHDVSKTPVCVYFIIQNLKRIDPPIPLGTKHRLSRVHFYTNWRNFKAAKTIDDLPLK
jgi:hypothetical protein